MVRPPSISPTMILSTKSWYFSPILTMRGHSPAWWTVRDAKMTTRYSLVTPPEHILLKMRLF